MKKGKNAGFDVFDSMLSSVHSDRIDEEVLGN